MWILLYGVAIFLDIVGLILGFFAVGLIINRVITFFAFGGFLFTFFIMGIDLKGTIIKLLLGSAMEMTPIVGEVLPGWTTIVWRVHKSQSQPAPQEVAPDKEETVAEQAQEDQSSQEQVA